MSAPIDFATQAGAMDIARFQYKERKGRYLTGRKRALFKKIEEKWRPLLLEYPVELPTEEHVQSALHVIMQIKHGATPYHVPNYSSRLLKLIGTEENKKRGFTF